MTRARCFGLSRIQKLCDLRWAIFWGEQMKLPRVLVALCIALMTPGCAAIFDGTTQQISVNTTPPDARCKLMRLAAPIGEIASTPGAVTIQKTKHDITIVCSKSGYVDATYMNHSGVAGAAFANILGGILTGGIAWGIDSASGADNKYESQVNMTLLPVASLPASQPEISAPPQPQYSPPPPPPVAASGRSVPVTPAAATGPEHDCIRSDGMRMRVSGATCPPESTPTQ
jgi:hypothetical protein